MGKSLASCFLTHDVGLNVFFIHVCCVISIKYDDDDDDDDNDDDDDDDIGVPGPDLPFHVPPTPFLSSFFVSLLTPFLVTEILTKPSLLLVHLEPKMLLNIHPLFFSRTFVWDKATENRHDRNSRRSEPDDRHVIDAYDSDVQHVARLTVA